MGRYSTTNLHLQPPPILRLTHPISFTAKIILLAFNRFDMMLHIRKEYVFFKIQESLFCPEYKGTLDPAALYPMGLKPAMWKDIARLFQL